MPSTATDRLDGLSTSVAVKAPCVTVASSNITLSGLQTVSGVVLTEGKRVLLVGQTDQTENGVYDASTGSWIRSKDFDGSRDVVQGTRILVAFPSSLHASEYEVTSANPIIIGSTELTFVLRYGANIVYDRTQAEITAGITPTNYMYPEGHVMRYGAIGNGVANDTTAVQTAMTIAQSIKGTAYIPVGVFLCDAGLLLTFSGHRYTSGFCMAGSGPGSIIRVRGTPTGFIFIEMRGATPTAAPQDSIIRFHNFTIEKLGAISGTGLLLNNVANFHLSSMIIRGFDKCLYLLSALIGSTDEYCSFTDANYGVHALQNGFPGITGSTAGSTVNLIDLKGRFNYCASWGIFYDQGGGLFIDGDVEANGTPGNANTGGILIGANLAPDSQVAKIEIRAWLEANFGHQIRIEAPAGVSNNTIVIKPRTLLGSESGRAIRIDGCLQLNIADLVCGPTETFDLVADHGTLINVRTDILFTTITYPVFINVATSTAEHPFGQRIPWTATLTGISGSATADFIGILQGDRVWLKGEKVAPSTSTAATITGMPAELRPASTTLIEVVIMDNSIQAAGFGSIASTGVITLFNGYATAVFTAAGNKGLAFMDVCYEK